MLAPLNWENQVSPKNSIQRVRYQGHSYNHLLIFMTPYLVLCNSDNCGVGVGSLSQRLISCGPPHFNSDNCLSFRLEVVASNQHFYASVIHHQRGQILSASTKEPWIRTRLYRTNDRQGDMQQLIARFAVFQLLIKFVPTFLFAEIMF